jgi:hypothetical protein
VVAAPGEVHQIDVGAAGGQHLGKRSQVASVGPVAVEEEEVGAEGVAVGETDALDWNGRRAFDGEFLELERRAQDDESGGAGRGRGEKDNEQNDEASRPEARGRRRRRCARIARCSHDETRG